MSGAVQDVAARLARLPHAGGAASVEAALLLAAVEACPVNITISDLRRPDHPLTYVNPSFTETTGYTAAEVLGRNCRFLQGPETSEEAVQQIRDAVAARRALSVELLNYRRDGTPFLNRLELGPVTDHAAGIDAYIGIQTDITAFRAAETTRREREKLEALGRLAGGFAHELNNLLQPIVTYADLLGARLADNDAETAEQVAAILDSAKAARDIAGKVLHFARRSAPDAGAAPAGQRLAEAVRFAARLLPPGVTIQVNALEEVTAPWAVDPTELVQVLGNLFKNAADAMAGQGCIAVSAAQRADRLVLRVADDGPGMDAATAARVFEPFFTTKRVGEGTGLGLSAVWGLVEGWGGRIALHTAPGRGARFTIEVPINIPPDAAPRPAA